ncbi:hypothetical protein PSP6_510086 [Paraburkholderia tropica]|nr:hypothetical protein PSP6_510086 [Paraburkholderia tropica]
MFKAKKHACHSSEIASGAIRLTLFWESFIQLAMLDNKLMGA